MVKDGDLYKSSRCKLRCVECGIVFYRTFRYRREAHKFYSSGDVGVVIQIECPEALKKNQHHLVVLESLII